MTNSINAVFLTGLTGLRAAQTQLSVASQNIANANTEGYVRAEVKLSPAVQLGIGSGVNIDGVRRAADRFLSAAAQAAEGARAASSVRADLLSRAQASFGDPASDTSAFAVLDEVWTALAELGVDPSSALRRNDAVNALQTTYAEMQRVGQTIQGLILEADERIADAVSRAQGLIDRIAELNQQIQLNRRSGADATGAENAQSALIDELSALVDVRVTPQADGSVHVRTTGGALLVGVSAARLNYSPNSAPFAAHDVITVNAELGAQSNLEPFLLGGELKGLLQVRDVDLPALAQTLGGFAATLADALNEVHNENVSAPALGALTGRQTGLLAGDALSFTGRASIGVVDAGGVLRERLSIDFDAKTITGEAPAATYSFAGGTVGDFASALNAALGAATPAGSASFTNGVLSLNTSAGGGLAVQQDSANPSARAGRGFAHFFGLNDIVTRPTPLFFETGLKGTDAHGLNAGGEISYDVRDAAGRFIAERTVSISGALAAPGATWNDVIAALNASGSGLGEFGAFSIDASTGRITFAGNPAYQVHQVTDSTLRGATGLSFSALNGLSEASTAGRALEANVDARIQADPLCLAVARPNLTGALGQRVIEGGDSRGAAALLAARDTVRAIPAAGVLSGQTTTLAVYAARLGGEAGRLAGDATRTANGARAVADAAANRRAEVEGVSLDDELLRLTTFQNAYAASARVIQAAQELLDVLLSIGIR